MAFWRITEAGLELSVRVTPKGGRDAIDGTATLSDGREVLKVRVRTAPEDGAANAAVTKLIARAAGVSASRVTLASGATARLKTFRIEGEGETLAAALQAEARG